ncbi:excinuclease ABC subunit UvrA [Blastopirellula retiformator]|uniref:UvrABC system protein A n=1 Tax=Blastopirellula retiformator TaxID=2527970 RepID=A0A5C5V2X3_9BACT|nr:excinuclease ABC subunit UvrA [Blastopirellula retiformator]TWT32868.1 UvrABC system protein A [Blastopirellula retiformator]
MPNTSIQLRGVEVHNLKKVDLDLAHRKLFVFCGVSGSGKTSMALDTLYAEGQRRYIESFSAYTRQFLERLEKPAAESIDGIPPALAVTRGNDSRSNRSTVGTATETTDYLRLLFAKIGEIYCPCCGARIQRDTPQDVAQQILEMNFAGRMMLTFPVAPDQEESWDQVVADLREDGFVRVILGQKTLNLTSDAQQLNGGPVQAIADRLSGEGLKAERLQESLETAFLHGEGVCQLLVESEEQGAADPSSLQEVDGRVWRRQVYSNQLRCETCDKEFIEPEPRLFNFNSPLGACQACEGFGNVIDMDMDLIVPDVSKSLADGAIAPWNTPAYHHELEELLALAPDYNIPTNVPFRELTEDHLRLIREGVPEREFGGLKGFFQWLERRKYKMHLRVFLSRWRSFRDCESCHGQRLRPESLAVRIGGKNIAEISTMKIRDAYEFFQSLKLPPREQAIARQVLTQLLDRLKYLNVVGLGYLSLDRTIRTLSGGEAQRVALTSTLGSSLVNMLYVFDEPSVGLHPVDVERLAGAIQDLNRRGNTVVLVEHEESMIRRADEIIEFGPGAGERGGEIVFQGTAKELLTSEETLTGDYLMGRRKVIHLEKRRDTTHGRVRVKGARGNNLKNIEVEFPLGVLCVVTGVSGAGKSTLVDNTLYPALCRRKRKEAPKPLDCDDVFGDGQIDDVVLVDQSPIGRSPRSNPVTYIKAFDEIRSVFAATVQARTHNFTASHFSFNVAGGRCDACDGDGHIAIDMQFLADVYMKCPECKGRRYKKDVLEVMYRGKNIAEVLNMTIREAFVFFRGQPKVQAKLQRLIDVGLDYLRLGQPANTLSAGEAQRLKLAGYLASSKRGRTLFLLDEPTTGLHFADIAQLLDCFNSLLQVGHSLIVVEHNLHMMMAADYIIDMGPGAADEGGMVVATGTPEEVAQNQNSRTGRALAEALLSRSGVRLGPRDE